jgi:hypothetical protein
MLRRRERERVKRMSGSERKENRTSKQVQIHSMTKANKVVGCVWGKGERKWRGNFRIIMFESMIESILMCGTEIWGWKE